MRVIEPDPMFLQLEWQVVFGNLMPISPIRFKKMVRYATGLEVLLRWTGTTTITLYCPAARKGQT